jgi:hypothetical protein
MGFEGVTEGSGTSDPVRDEGNSNPFQKVNSCNKYQLNSFNYENGREKGGKKYFFGGE